MCCITLAEIAKVILVLVMSSPSSVRFPAEARSYIFVITVALSLFTPHVLTQWLQINLLVD